MKIDDEKLDEALAHWRRVAAATPERHDALSAEICRRANDHSVAASPTDVDVMGLKSMRGPCPRPWHSRLVGRRPLAAAACVAVIAVAALALRSSREKPRTSDEPLESPSIVNLARFSNEGLAGKSRLADEMRSVFSSQFVGFVEVDGDVQIALASDNRQGDEAQPMTAVRYLLVARSAGQPWSVVKTMECVAQCEEVVEQSSADRSGVGVWVYLLDDGQMMIESRISLNGAAPLSVTSSGIQRQGQPEVILRQTIDGVEYRLIQTPALLTNRLG